MWWPNNIHTTRTISSNPVEVAIPAVFQSINQHQSGWLGMAWHSRQMAPRNDKNQSHQGFTLQPASQLFGFLARASATIHRYYSLRTNDNFLSAASVRAKEKKPNGERNGAVDRRGSVKYLHLNHEFFLQSQSLRWFCVAVKKGVKCKLLYNNKLRQFFNSNGYLV